MDDSGDGAVFGSPVVFGGALCCGCSDGYLYGLDAAAGRVIWELKAAVNVWGTPVVAADTILIAGGDSSLRAFG